MLLDTPICEFGWQAPDFTLPDPEGRTFTMTDYLSDKGVLVMFICNHCPYVQRIAASLAADTAALMAEGINVLAIMSNDYHLVPEDSPSNMTLFAQRHGFKFPYLVDETQNVARAYGAVCTPDFFGLNRDGKLHYRGRFDEVPVGEGAATRSHGLADAMRLIARTGQGPRAQTPSMGCSIKWRG